MKDESGVGSFCLGCFLIPFSLVLLWKNERKLVMYAKCIGKGREKVRNVDCNEPDEANDFELVHMSGVTVNREDIADPDFGLIVNNAYQLRRKVEMYQWKETIKTKEDDDGYSRKEYSYNRIWSEEKIDSS